MSKPAKFKTAIELKITPRERKYLIQSAKILARMKPREIIDIRDDGKFQFRMWSAGQNLPGGETAGCIARLANLLAETKENAPLFCWGGRIKGYSPVLSKLFFPLCASPGLDYATVTPKRAAYGIIHFLRTGKNLPLSEWKEPI